MLIPDNADNSTVAGTQVRQWVDSFSLDPALVGHTVEVLDSLPTLVRDDLVGDPHFILCDYEPVPGSAFHVPVKLTIKPRGRGASGRSVVLKRTLRRRPAAFVRYVIAHELAHAYLRNGGRFPGEDPEHAADALAATWGHPRPTVWQTLPIDERP